MQNMLLLEVNRSAASMNLDEAVVALAITRVIVAEYATLEMPAPKEHTARLSELEREAKARRRDYLMLSLKQAKQRKESLKTPDEKRRETDAEIASIEAQLEK